jgi:hypothetical protein
MADRLHSIELQNFKAFPAYEKICLDGNHGLIWGVNGTGKSTIFWALYTFLQSSMKAANGHHKYFAEVHDESLRNIFSTEESFLQLNFGPITRNPIIVPYQLSLTADDSKTTFIKGLSGSSEFITHRLLLNFSNYRNSEQLNVWPYFLRDVLPYYSSTTGTNLWDLYNQIKDNLNNETPSRLIDLFKEFNDGLLDRVDQLRFVAPGEAENAITKFYNEHLAEPDEAAEIDFYVPSILRYSGNRPNRVLQSPVVTIEAKFGKKGQPLSDVKKPHIFFNEARMNAIALAMRFVLMKERVVPGGSNILCLDDLLISLDMHNRMKVIKLLLKHYTTDYQIIVLTHDKGFFQLFQSMIADQHKEWKTLILYETALDKNPDVQYQQTEYLAKAKSFFKAKEFEGCALFLRKQAEYVLTRYLDPSLDTVWRSDNDRTLQTLINQAKSLNMKMTKSVLKSVTDTTRTNREMEGIIGTKRMHYQDAVHKVAINKYRNNLVKQIIELRNDKAERDDLKALLNKVELMKDRSLNPGAHFSWDPLIQTEMEEAIKTIEELTIEIRKLRKWDD